MNALLREWDTPFGIPPFAEIGHEDFEAAFEAALDEAWQAVVRIAEDLEPASFANTIEALERSDRQLARVSSVFFNLAATDTNEVLRALQRDISPKLAAFRSEMAMNGTLFARIDELFRNRESLGLTFEQDRVLMLYHRMFLRAGARLEGEARTRLAAVMQQLASLETRFGQNVLTEELDWTLPLGPEDLVGLPHWLVAAAEEAARERGREGHAITLSRSLIVPFLTFSPRRNLRERAFMAWRTRGANDGETDNRPVIAEMLRLREERARLLGYPNFAAFKLETEMAKTSEAVLELLSTVWAPARSSADADARRLSDMMRADGINDALRAWDWRYYSAIRQKQEHDVDEAEVKPYMNLHAMIAAAFDVAGRLFDLAFQEVELPLYHPDARAWQVTRGSRFMGLFIGDYFARPSKRSGAWCSTFRSQQKLDGEIRPIVLNVCNFAKAPQGEKSLLNFDDARTLFHEFGHALHQLMSDVTYKLVSGTSVARDFVELPSQLLEHWLSVPEVLERHARHVRTGKPMPRELLEKVLAARTYDTGFDTVEYLASAFVDLDLHAQSAPEDSAAAERHTLARLGMPEAITMRHASTHFLHIFSGDGYSAGYYSYLWSELMDADAFAAFEETGDPFDPAVAALLAQHIFSTGGSRDPEELYTLFRGTMPGVEALLANRGLMAA